MIIIILSTILDSLPTLMSLLTPCRSILNPVKLHSLFRVKRSNNAVAPWHQDMTIIFDGQWNKEVRAGMNHAESIVLWLIHVLQVKGNDDGTILNHLEPRFIRSGSHVHLKSGVGPDHPMLPVEGGLNVIESLSITNPQALARAIDETCRYCFPLAFAFFNFVYWPYYCL